MTKVGTELEFVRGRLQDIAFIALNGEPVEGADPESVVKLIGDLARQAIARLDVYQQR